MSATRGTGLLEGWLSRKRAKMADRLIPAKLRGGRILDIGCGSTPQFLLSTRFGEKHGLDQLDLTTPEGITITKHNLNSRKLPYPSGYFEVVTMLAVFEHVKPTAIRRTLTEIKRVLKPGGRLVMTTPTPLADEILHLWELVGLISSEELEEHENVHSKASVRRLLEDARFSAVQVGSFELGLNTWAWAEK